MSGPPLVALSISESPDLAWLGLGPPHLEEAMVEIARYLLIAGASLAYGGDLRPGGFTRQLFEMVRTYRRDSPETLPIANYLAWPAHSARPDQEIDELQREFDGAGRLIFLDPEGRDLTAEERRRLRRERGWQAEAPEARAAGYTAMRRRMAGDYDARLLLGGKVKGYGGAMPGIAEEALLTLEMGKPLYAIGGFGGCTRDLIYRLEGPNGRASWPERRPEETGPGYRESMRAFGGRSWEDLRNGLSREDNQALATASQPAVILRYVLQGLRRRGFLAAGSSRETRRGSWDLS